MSGLLYGKAIDVRVGNLTAKTVLMILANFADENNRAWPSVDTLKAKMEVSERTVQRALRYLESKHLIVRDYGYGTRYRADRSPYVYEIVLDGKPTVGSRQRNDGVTLVTPRDDDPRGDTHDTPNDNGVTSMTPRGDTGDAHGVTLVTPRGDTSDTQTTIEPPIEPPRESTRASKPLTEQQKRALADWTPDTDSVAEAARLGMDCETEAMAFRDYVRDGGHMPCDIDSGFRKFLRSGHSLGIRNEPAVETKPCRHTWKCEHVTAILRQFDLNPDTSYDLACGIAGRLRDGVPPDTVIEEIQTMRDDMWELA